MIVREIEPQHGQPPPLELLRRKGRLKLRCFVDLRLPFELEAPVQLYESVDRG